MSKVKEAREAADRSLEQFIRDKYVNRQFINQNELDYTGNYVDELNRMLISAVAGRSLAMTIYYVFLGANLNARIDGKTPLEHSVDYQTIYLFFQVIFTLHYTAGFINLLIINRNYLGL